MSAEAVRTLRLHVVYDDHASAPARQFHAQEKARIADTAKEQEKADAAYVRAIKVKARAMNDFAREVEARAKERDREQARSEAAYVKSVKTMARAEKELEGQKAKATQKALSDQDKEEQAYVRAVKMKLRAEKQIEDEKERAARKAQREQEKSEAAYVRAVRQQLNAQKQLEDQHMRGAEAAAAQTAGVVKMGLALVGLNSGAMIIGALAEHFDKIRQDAFRAAESVMQMRGAVRELQALRDEFGKTGPGVAHIMKGAAETLQTPEEFKQMELAGLGVGELAIGKGKGKTMDRAGFEEFMKSAGKKQAMEGGDAGAWGEMAGLIALQSKERMTPEEAEAKLERLFQIQKPGAFTSMTQAIGQYKKLGGMISNDILTPEEGMGLVSAQASAGVKEEAGTHAEQLARAMLAGRLKARGIKLAADVDAEKTSQYMEKLGIKAEHTVMQRAAIVSADVARNTGAGKENATEYLIRHGFGNEEERQAIMGYSGLKSAGKLEKIEAAQNALPQPGVISKEFEEWKKTDNLARNRQIDLIREAGRTKVGLEEEPLVLAQKAAFHKLYAEGKIKGTFEEWQANESGLGGFANRFIENTFFGDYHQQVNREAGNALKAERDRLGLPKEGDWFGDEYGAMKQTAQAVQRAGGDVTGGNSDALLRELIAAIKEQTDEIKKQGKDNGAPKVGPPLSAPMPPGGFR
jgi:hypothetical protein